MSRTVALALVLLTLPAAYAEDAPAPDEAALLEDLRSGDFQTRRRAVLAIEGRTEATLLDHLLAVAADDPHPNIRGFAAGVLATFEDPRVFPVLAALAKARPPGPRHEALVALGRHGDPRAYDILRPALEAGRITRGYAAKGLGLLGDLRAFEPIAAIYRAHPDDPYLNDMAPEALVRLDRTRGLATCLDAFTTFPAVARPGLARVLCAHPSPPTRALMLDLVRTASDPGVRRLAAQVLADVADEDSVPELLARFEAEPDLRTVLAGAFGRLKATAAVVPLVAALGAAKQPRARHVYMAALGRIGDERAVAILAASLTDTGFAAQPMRQSSISGFPFNVETRGVALWAVRHVLDGAPPFDLERLVTFPRRPLDRELEQQLRKLRSWWAEHEKDPRYHLPE